MEHTETWPALHKDDAGLLKDIQATLERRVQGDPYSEDGEFARNLSSLPKGLRAMAVTHWLDVSLTLDSITWHFGNFGEAGLVALTEDGLAELGLGELRACFTEAKNLMQPLLADRKDTDGDPYEILERNGLEAVGRALDERAWNLDGSDVHGSAIYAAWVRYAREHPQEVFEI